MFRGEIDGMEDAVYDVATAAYDQLLTARSLLSQIPREAFPALLSAVSCDYLCVMRMIVI